MMGEAVRPSGDFIEKTQTLEHSRKLPEVSMGTLNVASGRVNVVHS
jgi:hypothetical protein